MLRIATWLIFGVLIPASACAEHGGTKALEEARRERQKQLSGKILNESLPVFWSSDGKSALFHLEVAAGKRAWRQLDLETGEITDLQGKPKDSVKGIVTPEREKPTQPAVISKQAPQSPDKQHKVSFRDGKVFLDDEKKLAAPGDDLQWQDRVMWSPDSTRFVVWKRSDHPVREIHYVRSAPKDSLQPEHFTARYPKPGDDLNIGHPVIAFCDDRKPIEVDPALIKEPFDLRNFGWRGDGKRFVFEFIERGFGKHRLIEIDTETGEQRVLIDERDDKFIHVFGNSFRRDLKGGDEILWLSERDGWNHLYLIDGKSGAVIRQLTSGEWVVREVIDVNESSRTAIIKVSGYHPDQDPYHIHYARIHLNDGTLTPLSDGDGTHELRWSPDGSHYHAKWSRVDQPPVHEIRRSSDGKKLATIAAASSLDALVNSGWQKPQRFVARDRHDEYDIHGIILRPSDFDPQKNYAVVEAIYAGPHGSFTPRAWKAHHGNLSEMADAGFIVVKLDGLGTNHRGRKFQQVAYQNLIDSGLPDRVKWITAAAVEVPQMDLERVGLYGGSAGGQSTLAGLLTHGDFYKAGAADCGCHDNRMDKIWWNEQWLDWPIGPQYQANSNVTHAAKLSGKLLLTVGELDRNVDPSSTLQVVDALIKADKDFEFFIVPGAGHGVGETPFLRRQRIEFFRRHLGGPRTR